MDGFPSSHPLPIKRPLHLHPPDLLPIPQLMRREYDGIMMENLKHPVETCRNWVSPWPFFTNQSKGSSGNDSPWFHGLPDPSPCYPSFACSLSPGMPVQLPNTKATGRKWITKDLNNGWSVAPTGYFSRDFWCGCLFQLVLKNISHFSLGSQTASKQYRTWKTRLQSTTVELVPGNSSHLQSPDVPGRPNMQRVCSQNSWSNASSVRPDLGQSQPSNDRPTVPQWLWPNTMANLRSLPKKK